MVQRNLINPPAPFSITELSPRHTPCCRLVLSEESLEPYLLALFPTLRPCLGHSLYIHPCPSHTCPRSPRRTACTTSGKYNRFPSTCFCAYHWFGIIPFLQTKIKTEHLKEWPNNSYHTWFEINQCWKTATTKQKATLTQKRQPGITADTQSIKEVYTPRPSWKTSNLKVLPQHTT